MFQRILVPLDGSPTAEIALDFAAPIAEQFAARLVLLRAYAGAEQSARLLAIAQSQPGGMMDPQTINLVTETAEVAEQDSREYLAAQAQRLAGRGFAVDTVHVDGEPADAILDEAKRDAQTLIVISSHGRGGLGRAVFGSVTESVLHKATAPLLLVRAYVSEATRGAEGGDMEIEIGADVMGTDGKLGEVDRVIVDARSDKVTDIVVKHGFVFGRERVVPLRHVLNTEGGNVYLDMDKRMFETMDGFSDDRYRAPDPSYSGPPGYNNEQFLMDETVAIGPMAAYGGTGAPLGFPGGEQTSPDDMARPTVSAGTHVLDVDGEKVGEVHEVSFNAANGAINHLSIRRGLIFKHDTELPADWVKEVSDDGVMLRVRKGEVEALVAEEK